MELKLYVSNLAYSTTESALQQLFSQSGTVASVRLVKDRASGQSKGFAFVTMATAAGAHKAIEKFHNFSLAGRRLTVNMAEQSKTGATGGYPAKTGAPDGYQSKLGAFSATGRSPSVTTLKRSQPGDGYKSKLSAFGNNNVGQTQPRRRGRDQRH